MEYWNNGRMGYKERKEFNLLIYSNPSFQHSIIPVYYNPNKSLIFPIAFRLNSANSSREI